MVSTSSRRFSISKFAITAVFVVALAISPLTMIYAHEHETSAGSGKDKLAAESFKEITGEVVDMMCYIDHSAMGEKHGGSCGSTCIKSGGPVGIVSEGKAYLVVGEHKPINDQLAEYCGKTITVKGKLAERGGVAMIENVEVVRK